MPTQKVFVTTGQRKVIKGIALPVRVVTDPNDVAGGAAMPIYVLSASDIQSGRFHLESSDPIMNVYQVTSGPVTQGAAQAVYVVSGVLS